jgi:outer membrane protein TolC
MMTASTTSLGLLPLALALGEGGETQAPMARVVIGGLLTSTLITLLLIPVVYSIVEERHIKKKKLGKSEKLSITAILGFLVFIFTPGEPTAATDDTLRISLENMLNRAVKDNPLLNIERIDINIAEATVRENRYKFEPLLNAAIEQKTAINDTVSSSPGYAGSVALLQQFPTGTSLEMKGTAMEMSRNNVPSLPYQRTFSLTVTQALLADGGLGPNLADIRKSSIDVDLRKEELAGYAQKLLSETEKAYWSVYLAEKEVGIHKKSLHLVERLFYESNERLKVGRLAPLDLVAVKAEAALRQKNMIAAEAAFIQKKYQLAYYTHDSLSKWNRPVLLIDQTPKPEYPDSITLHIKAAYKYRPDLRQIVLTKDRGGITLVQTRNGLLPKLDLFIALSGTAYAESFGNVFSGVPDNQNEIAAGLSFSFPVTNGAAREKYNKEQLNQKQLTLSIDNMTRLVELDVRIAWVELEKTFKQLEAAKVTRELQEEKLAAEQVKLGAGKSTEYFVLQAQRDLIAAQLEEVRADVAYVNARTDLFVKDGTLLERRGVKSLPN